MKKNYIKPEIEEISTSMQLLVGSGTMDFMQTTDPLDTDDEVNDFGQLL